MKNFYLETYGCKLNQSDSDLIRGILLENFKETDLKKADFVVINSCGVVEKTERKIIKRIKELKKLKKKIILAGCLSLISQKAKRLSDGVIGPKDILSIKKVAEGVIKGEKIIVLSPKNKNFIDKSEFCYLKKRKRGEVSAIVPISEGCLGNCSYCITKEARGKLISYKMENILREIESLIKNGYKEIQLTSQDASIYGLDKGKFLLPHLLKKITEIKGEFRIRVGMMNPRFLKFFVNDLIPVYRSKKIYKFIHLPLQSADNRILKLMKRGLEY
jgi:threonylcarbamoyladenosine tRNA methylthiotransferase CDKAL1